VRYGYVLVHGCISSICDESYIDVALCEWDVAELLAALNVIVNFLTVLGSASAFADIVVSKRRQMKQC
jgi:hypothetical protein